MFERIRRQLVAWNLLVLALILVSVTALAYGILTRNLLNQADNGLALQSDEVVNELYHHDLRSPAFRAAPEGYRGGFFTFIVSPSGQILANPQQVNLAPSALPRIPDQAGVFTTVTVDGSPVRILARSLDTTGPTPVILVVGRSFTDEADILGALLLVFVGGGLVGLLLSLVGAWFLAGRALVPIRRAFQRQQEFVADASHELRTPLTVVHAAVDLLNQHRDEPLEANAELLDDLRFEIGRLERLTSDLLTLARSDQGELGLAMGDLELGSFAADVARRALPLARGRGIDLTWQSAAAPLVVEGDPDRLEQVLLILIDNAVKHSASGARVTVTARPAGNAAVVEVSDEGEGISPEHLPRVFERFYRADKGRSRVEGSAGLGLAIARTLVEAHGGRISIASKVGVGTTVTISLPARDQPLSLADRLHLSVSSRGE